MKAAYNFFIRIEIRLGLMLSLIFFVLLSAACRNDEKENISVVWKNNQAIGIIVPVHLLQSSDSIQQLLQVRIENNQTSMLGDYSVKDESVLFQPLVPLSRGINYNVLFREKIIGKIKLPHDVNAKPPRLVAVYPSTDTVPENLLKVYFQFSKPMREGEALQHIALLDGNNDTLVGTFLNLLPELWNKERTALTVWLDPGRIKRDLVPNREMGNPLQKGKRYTLIVSDRWRDTEGIHLEKHFRKSFFVAGRDDTLPQIQSWSLNIPKSSTLAPLIINLTEPLDYFLLEETITVFDEHNRIVEGSIHIKKAETSFEFTPALPWKAGPYNLKVASHLEDLAGNNLVRPFDRDVTKQDWKDEVNFYKRTFIVQ